MNIKKIKDFIKNNNDNIKGGIIVLILSIIAVAIISLLLILLVSVLSLKNVKDQNTKAIVTQLVSEEKYDEALDILWNNLNKDEFKEYYDEVKELKNDYIAYNSAFDYMESEMYIQAACKFAKCIEYKDSKELMEECIKNAILQDYSEYELMIIMNSIED